MCLSSFRPHLVGSSGLEPPTSRLSGVRSNHLSYEPISAEPRPMTFVRPFGGDERDRTDDPLLAKQVLSQLSYTPTYIAEWCLPFILFEDLFGPSKLNND